MNDFAARPIDLLKSPNFALGQTRVCPAARTLTDKGGRAVLEPRMMQVLVQLAQRPGEVVTRQALVERCWGGAPVGDDSVNRAIAGIRRAARAACADSFEIETIAGAGYLLTVGSSPANAGKAVDEAVEKGWHSWRRGLPSPDLPAIDALRATVDRQPSRADAWGMLALLLRNAAEYAEAAECDRLVQECECAAVRALCLEPMQTEARAAMISLPPLFGDWIGRRSRLLAALEDDPGGIPLRHELAVLEMATGRPSAAIPIIAELVEKDPLAALFQYKRTYHLWALGELGEMDRAADRALQLWPRHPAIWFARFWSLAFTGRPRQAAQQLGDAELRPPIPPPALATFETTVASLLDPGSEAKRHAAVRANVAAAERGPAQSVAAIIHLSGIGAVEECFLVAQGYFLRSGEMAVGARKSGSDPSVNDQHRRVTQMLFLPVTEPLRRDPRFAGLCSDMGLSEYWRRAALVPDFASA